MPDNGHRENGNVVGAVMVVGGGIAGMQAALDLAESGYKVYLVEQKSAIGGHMAQLDKTFPTNDCAMCTISPRLVEAGRHLNIEILTDSEVAGLKGTAGDFTATVRTRPRYIDVSKCTGCGECADVCPVVIPGRFDEGLRQQRAAHRLYPQAIPNAYAIEKRGIAPCRDACPAGQRAQGYIALIREGRFDDALRVIKEDNPFPGICGRICNHRCEDACNRGKVDDPVNIHTLKRFVTDTVYARPRVPPQPIPKRYEERVAIIGAGPCGLTTAQDLVKLGYPVTVFEALPVAGGMLRVGVPEYRLPGWIVDREVQDIIDLGVELRLNTTVANLDDLFAEGFKAVLVAVGAHEGIRLPIPGKDLEGVLINTQFLQDVRLAELRGESASRRDGGSADDYTDPRAMIQGKRVLVLGGGNVAIDVARTAVRLGASEAHMACLEGRHNMPAHLWEVQAALDEGIVIHNDRTFVRVVDDGNGRAAGVECRRVAHFEFDDQGRLSVETVEGSEHVLPADVVIFSVGQRAGLAFIPPDAGVGLTPRRTIAVNPNTFAATRPGVFAAGDSVSGTAFVIEAVASGHKCAESIHRYLRGEALEPRLRPELPVVKLTQVELDERMRHGEIKITPRVPVPELPVTERVKGFAEVETGYTPELAQAEAARCLACGICSECLSCWYKCGVGAIDHNMVERMRELNVGAIILAPGYQVYRAELSEEYGWGRYPNVVTALQFERLLSASGPTMGHVRRPSDGKTPKKIAFLQCVGSRDQSHDYCSAVCCMYATKEAIMAVEHEPDTEVHVFMMDMRAFSKGYEAYYHRAMEQYGIRYTRCRISSVKEDPATKNLILRYVSESASQRVSELRFADSPIRRFADSPIREEEFDLVVLSVGMEISESVRELGRKLGIELDEYGFCHTVQFDPLQTSRPGIYAVGPFREPKDIPETVVEASGAAALAGGLLAPARGTLVTPPIYPPERDISGEQPRIGVFVCHCGSNIGGFLDVPAVAEYAATLPHVVHAEHNLYTCSQDSIQRITEKAKELGLNRVVVASCTPRTHEPLFQDSIRQAGLNPYLFEMANIRNQCSWVHSDNWDAATEKAKDLVRMAVARADRLNPLYKQVLPVQQRALVIGGGLAGMTAALALSAQGFPVDLVERSGQLGGNLRHVCFVADGKNGQVSPSTVQWSGSKSGTGTNGSTDSAFDPQAFLVDLVQRVEADPRITVHLNVEVVESSGFTGNFTSTLRTTRPGPSSLPSDRLHGCHAEERSDEPSRPAEVHRDSSLAACPGRQARDSLGMTCRGVSGAGNGTGQETTIRHGVTIVATGGREYRGKEYGYGSDPRILTQQEFEARLAEWAGEQGSRGAGERAAIPIFNFQSPISNPQSLCLATGQAAIRNVAMILCVGPAEKYCGRICCTTALKNAIKVKELNPEARVTVIYKDIRTFGFKERLYTRAREMGIIFMRYDDDHRPQVSTSAADFGSLDTLEVRAWEPVFGEWMTFNPDLLVLSTPMVPAEGSRELGTVLKVPVDLNGWFLEAHPKLRPVDFASDGIYMAGAAHYPKLIDESIAQAQAAAARAATVLSHETMAVGGVIAQVKAEQCVGCLTCVRACPYHVPAVDGARAGVGGIFGAAYINPAQCHGCGICAAECPARAIKLMHYTDGQVEGKVSALFELERVKV